MAPSNHDGGLSLGLYIVKNIIAEQGGRISVELDKNMGSVRAHIEKGRRMKPGREIDTAIAQEVLGHTVKVKKKELWEVTPSGERPLRKYSKEIGAAWEIIEKMNMTIIPIENGQWFALVGLGRPWENPAAFLKYLQSGQFARAGAAVGQEIPLTVCLAALKGVKTATVVTSSIDAVNDSAGLGDTRSKTQNLHH